MSFAPKLPEGYERRGFKFKVYLTPEQESKIEEIQYSSMVYWNRMVDESNDAYRAFVASRIRNDSSVGPKPIRPENDAGEEAFDKYKEEMKAFNKRLGKVPKGTFRSIKEYCEQHQVKNDYQYINKFLSWKELPTLHSNIAQSLQKGFYSKGVKKKRKKFSDMPVRTGTGTKIKFGEFYKDGFRRRYDLMLFFPSIGWIYGRSGKGRNPDGKIEEGATLVKEADGWYASIKQIVPIRKPKDFIPGKKAGIDVGLRNIASIVDNQGNKLNVVNPRNVQWQDDITKLRNLKYDTSRMETTMARRCKQICYEVVRDLSDYEQINIEELNNKEFLWNGTKYKSSARIFVDILKQRLGARVREVQSAYTSQDCSQCGNHSKEDWKMEREIGKCSICGHEEHRDLNAARNILSKQLKSLSL